MQRWVLNCLIAIFSQKCVLIISHNCIFCVAYWFKTPEGLNPCCCVSCIGPCYQQRVFCSSCCLLYPYHQRWNLALCGSRGKSFYTINVSSSIHFTTESVFCILVLFLFSSWALLQRCCFTIHSRPTVTSDSVAVSCSCGYW